MLVCTEHLVSCANPTQQVAANTCPSKALYLHKNETCNLIEKLCMWMDGYDQSQYHVYVIPFRGKISPILAANRAAHLRNTTYKFFCLLIRREAFISGPWKLVYLFLAVFPANAHTVRRSSAKSPYHSPCVEYTRLSPYAHRIEALPYFAHGSGGYYHTHAGHGATRISGHTHLCIPSGSCQYRIESFQKGSTHSKLSAYL